MRLLVLAVLCATLCTSASAQDGGLRIHRVGLLTVTLPAAFESIIAGGTSVVESEGIELRQALFTDPSSGRMVGVLSYTGQSWWQRFRFKRGFGASDATPHTYRRVSPRALPLSDEFGATVGAAFTLETERGESAVLVRGCDADVCYEVTAGGPSTGRDASGLQFAGLLSGVNR